MGLPLQVMSKYTKLFLESSAAAIDVAIELFGLDNLLNESLQVNWIWLSAEIVNRCSLRHPSMEVSGNFDFGKQRRKSEK